MDFQTFCFVDTGFVLVDAGFAEAGLVEDFAAAFDATFDVGAASVEAVFAFAFEVVADFAGADLAGLAAAALAFSTFFASPETAF